MLEKFLKKEVIDTAKGLVHDNKTVIIAGTIVITLVGLVLIRQAFPVTVINNYVCTGGCWSPYHIPTNFVR